VPRYYLGVDGGGTNCRVRLADENLKTLAEVKNGRSNLQIDDGEPAYRAISEGTRDVFLAAGIDYAETANTYACFGMAGGRMDSARAEFAARPWPFAGVQVYDDIDIAHAGALGGEEGGVIIVGTGSAQGQLAEWPQRVVAFLLDIVCLLPLVIIQVIFSQISTALGLLVNLVVTAAALYFGYLNGATGQSPGKALTGLKVVSDNTGQVIGGGPGVIRQLAHFIDSFICFLGYFLPLVDAKKQTLADKVMGTVVITGAEKKPFGPEIFKAE